MFVARYYRKVSLTLTQDKILHTLANKNKKEKKRKKINK